jgi:hypothetical protein
MKKILKKIIDFGEIFLTAFLVTALVSALYGRIVYGACGLNWEMSVIFGSVFAVMFTWNDLGKNAKKNANRSKKE